MTIRKVPKQNHHFDTENELPMETNFVALIEVEEDFHFKYISVNKVYLDLLDAGVDNLCGKYVEEVLPKEIAHKAINFYKKVAISNKTISYEKVNDNRIYEGSLIPNTDGTGKCKYIIIMANDVTEEKKNEEQNLRVEKLESLGILAGGIAHDFNNILTAIIGNASLAGIKLNNTDDIDILKLKSLLAEIEIASKQAKNLTHQLLTFAKGGEPLVKTVQISEALKDNIDFTLRGTNVKAKYVIDSDLWPIKIDEAQINQALSNLVINASHAMRGGGFLEVSARNFYLTNNSFIPLPGGRYVEITIKDHGEGISKEKLSKIFDPYFTTKEMGSGLGLSITYSIIKKHNGYITVESELGTGTAFHIYLPVADDEFVQTTNNQFYKLTGKGKVLVMDDEKMIRLVLSEMLKQLGYEVVCCQEGQQTIETYIQAKSHNVPFDYVVMDLTIPAGMGGQETIKRLLEIDPNVKAIASSGYCNSPIMARYWEYGFKAVVAKPYSMEDLAHVLQIVENKGL